MECDKSNGIQLEDITYDNNILPKIVDAQEIRELDTRELKKKQKNTRTKTTIKEGKICTKSRHCQHITPNNVCSEAKKPPLLHLEGMDQL